MSRPRDHWRGRHAGYRRRGVRPPDEQETRQQELWRLHVRINRDPLIELMKNGHRETGDAPDDAE